MKRADTGRPHLFLIGMKHSGKSELGRLLAVRLGTRFFDLDHFIDRSARSEGYASVRDLYRSSGKDFFQEHERRAAVQLTAELKRELNPPAVCALGGGSVENDPAMRLLQPYGRFLYLRPAEELLSRRILGNELPPFLEGDAPPEELLRRLILRRSPLYERWADLTIDLPDAPKEENSARIYDRLEGRRHAG
jgi:shikimate kinase